MSAGSVNRETICVIRAGNSQESVGGSLAAALQRVVGRLGRMMFGAAGLQTALLAIAFGFSVCAGTVFAGQAGKVVEFGIYSEDHKLLKKTTRIPIRGGIRFGFCFEANIGFFEDRYMLVESLSHPPVTSTGDSEDTGYSVPRMFKVRNGVAHGCSGYRARDVSDLRPGVWKFTISDGDEELVSQEFNIK